MPTHPVLAALLDLLVPSTCAACGMPGACLCDACARGLPRLAVPGCARCGHPWPTAVPSCPECPWGVAWARQALDYDASVATVVRALKDHHRRALAPALALITSQVVERPPAGAVLVPVPLAPGRMRERGFNQAGLIADALAGEWGMPVAPVLTRGDGSPHQRGARRAQRIRQVQGAFVAHGPPLHAVLVDDVLTTGATISAAARALRAAGCARVGAVATARVVRGVTPARVGARRSTPEGGARWSSR